MSSTREPEGVRFDSNVKGVLLDVDGTLIDSNDSHAHAYVEAFAEYGLKIAFDRVRRLVGMGSDKLLPALGIEPHSRVAKHAGRRKTEIFASTYLPQLKPFRGSRDLLMHLRHLGITLVVATSARANELHDLLRVAKIGDLIESAADSSDVEASKPDPDIVQSAIERSKLPRENLFMLGDTPYDVEAANRAGVPCVVLRCGGFWSDRDFGNAAAIFDDPADLLAHFDALRDPKRATITSAKRAPEPA